MNEFTDNQYNSYYTSPVPEPKNVSGFSIASMIFGMMSVLLCCTGVFSVSAGALSILFAILSKRKGKAMPPLSLTGTILSCIGIVMGLSMLVYSVFTFLTDPKFRKAFEDSYGEYYQEFYNYGFEDLDYSSTDNTQFMIN